MSLIQVNFEKSVGKIKPMHATNNGPVGKINNMNVGWDVSNVTHDSHVIGANIYEFKMAGIPYARTHDASFYPTYGLEHTVDVAFIFPNFDADPTDPANYDFTCTDHYMNMIDAAGTKVFYRLGHRIEHEVKKYGTLPPKDFHKWAVICEHIIRHYTEGWADGMHRDMEYWEIWNEPDLDPDDAVNKRTWGGTKAQFFEFYHIAATHLKQCFPHLKIGGPAIAGKLAWAEDFLAQLKAPLDFFSWHVYAFTTEKVVDRAIKVRALLDKYGFTETESILNEWNYVRGWESGNIQYSYAVHSQIKGAAFTLATMCACQATPVDMLMYYDARPNTVWNGMFDMTQIEHSTLTGYYPFPMFNVLYRMGDEVESVTDDANVYVCAARGENGASVVLTHYNDDDATETKAVTVNLKGLGSRTEAEIYLLDDDHRLTLTQKLTFTGDLAWEIEVPNYTCYLVLLKQK